MRHHCFPLSSQGPFGRVHTTDDVVALIEQYSSIWLSVRWTQTAVFVVLVGYLTVLAVRSSAFTARFRRPIMRA